MFTIQPRIPFETSDTLWAGKLQLEFRPNDDMLWYAGVNRGVKAGSFNAQLADGSPLLTPDRIPYKPEELTSYEAGFKSTLFGGKARFNGAAYFYDYSDYQAFLFVLSSGTVTNKDAEMKGVELELAASPIAGLDLGVALSAFDAEVQDLELRGGAANVAPLLRDVKPSFAPELQASALIRYTWPIAAGSVSLQLDGAYTDDFYHNLRNFEADHYDSYTVGNVRVGYQNPDKTWEIAAFVRNFTDERYKSIGYDLATLCGCNEDAYGKPRWAGVSFNYSFGGSKK